MTLELRVWGPAFDLDSIDPECLAAITCFRCSIPREDWSLIASNDAAASPDYRLPALNHEGIWTSGYTEIVSYLTRQGILHIDDDLTPLQRADALACASFLATRGAALVAMSLYVSPRAWADMTRPAYSSLLPFPLTWTVPPGLRTAAIEKVENLGMGSLAPEGDAEESPSAGPAITTSTGFLKLRDRRGPSEVMQPENKAAIRFQHFATSFFETLEQLRGDNEFFLRDEKPASIDYLVFAYLELTRVQTPHPTLRNALEGSFGSLVGFSNAIRESFAAQALEADHNGLPLRDPEPRRVLDLIGRFAEGALESVPGFGGSWRRWRVGGARSAGAGDGNADAGADDVSQQDMGSVIMAAAGAVAGAAALGAVALVKALGPFGNETHRFEMQKNRLGQFDEMGAILTGLPVWEQSAPQWDVGSLSLGAGVDVGVESEVELRDRVQ
ncbi:Tom37 C-terminal domain-containing protein [Annulohypoxylon truncatum]|uniref:Tom37 C-terminal domain-containing protein n=1 Tax=Annulohypoxylon truncatum TaxID=327061 RepID=UPI0020077EF1|nr:Tom37 C-terminal domain-containing protein [Annulohypoxylon truncatum]KAI1204783.1 Tom37 C-terminal domain-containing protein [Annulohypoxylon truncatum]